MIQKDLLWSAWNIWLSYYVPEGEQKQGDYNDTLRKSLHLQSLTDLMYVMSESPYKSLTNFFVVESPEAGRNICPIYEIDGKQRKVNAINFFRDGIEPTWEDPNNSKGARLIFQIDSNETAQSQIYEWLVYYFLGESENCAQEINGIRFISAKPNAQIKIHYRVEVWTKFDEAELEKIKSFKDTFVKDFLETFNCKNFKPFFKNNK